MSDQDQKILTLILKKEADFSNEIRRLSALLTARKPADELSDYLAGLNDLKNDFLYPAAKSFPETSEPAALISADKYWYRHRA